MWEPGEEAWETKLAALRSYRRANGHLAPRQDALWGEGDSDDSRLAIGQFVANLRRKGPKNGLGKAPDRAAERSIQLAAIDKDWNCPWPLDWQRHYRVLTDLAETETGGILPAIAPGVLYDGDDLGRWLERHKQPHTWAQLSAEQQIRLTKLGVHPDQAPFPAPAADRTGKRPSKAQQAFQRGVEALTQYVVREGGLPARSVIEVLPDGTEHRTGIWYGNLKARRDKLAEEQLAALAAIGVDWAR